MEPPVLFLTAPLGTATCQQSSEATICLYTLPTACWPHPVFAEWCGGDRAQLMLCVALPENSAGLKISEEKLGSICF